MGLGSQCRAALESQVRAAAATGAFVFAHRDLDGPGALALAQHLRDDCRAKFVDLSSLGRWSECSLAAAAALKHGLRATRSLTLDGNAIGECPEILEAWCSALQAHPGLQHISLRGAGITDRAACRLSESLRGNPVLFSLDISQNRVGDVGVNAIADSVGESNVIMEVSVEGTDASDAAREDLEAALERNRNRFGGPDGGSAVLRALRRARAMALASVSRFAATAAPPQITRGGGGGTAGPSTAPQQHASAEGADLRTDLAASVFFEAGEGIMAELSARCEARWRYNAADQNLLVELRAKVGDLKTESRLEHGRAEERLARVADAQGALSDKLRPTEDRIIRLKEELSAEIEETRRVLQAQIQGKLALKAAEDELEAARQEAFRYKLGAAHLEHILKGRNREVAEELEALERRVRLTEQETEALEADNERCRKMLHALRFETERERFVPAGVAS